MSKIRRGGPCPKPQLLSRATRQCLRFSLAPPCPQWRALLPVLLCAGLLACASAVVAPVFRNRHPVLSVSKSMPCRRSALAGSACLPPARLSVSRGTPCRRSAVAGRARSRKLLSRATRQCLRFSVAPPCPPWRALLPVLLRAPRPHLSSSTRPQVATACPAPPAQVALDPASLPSLPSCPLLPALCLPALCLSASSPPCLL